MFNAAVQVISDGTDEVHGRVRPRGAQNEAYFQCRWWHGPTMTADTARGNANDWLVAWMCAFRLSAIAEL